MLQMEILRENLAKPLLKYNYAKVNDFGLVPS